MLRENIEKCSQCTMTRGQKKSLTKDKDIFKYLVKLRQSLKKERVRPEQLDDDVTSIKVNKIVAPVIDDPRQK